MDEERKIPGRALPFGEREAGVIPQPRMAGPAVHCMIINYQMLDTTISHERMAVKLAHPQLADLDNGQFFRQSGMTDEGFKQMTLRELYPYLQSGSVQNVKSSPRGASASMSPRRRSRRSRRLFQRGNLRSTPINSRRIGTRASWFSAASCNPGWRTTRRNTSTGPIWMPEKFSPVLLRVVPKNYYSGLSCRVTVRFDLTNKSNF